MNRKKSLGILIIAFGLLIFLVKSDLFHFSRLDLSIGNIISNFWPMVIVLIGGYSLVTNPASKAAGAVILAVGVFIQLNKLSSTNIPFFPFLLILLGIWFIFSRGSFNQNTSDSFSGIAIFSGSKIRNTSQNFIGGSAFSMFGGVDVDLRGANIAPMQEVKIDLFTAFGGVTLYVPQGWNVITSGLPLFGGWSNKTANSNFNPNAPVVRISCFAVFGGIDIKN